MSMDYVHLYEPHCRAQLSAEALSCQLKRGDKLQPGNGTMPQPTYFPG